MVNSERNQAAQRIKTCLTDIRGRMYRQVLLQRITSAFFCGLILLAILFLLNRVILLPIPISSISWIVMSVAVIVGVGLSVSYRKDLLSVACAVDEKMGLRERLGTAFGLIQTNPEDEFAQLQIRDAAETITTLERAKVSPYRVPMLLKLFPIPLLLIGISFAIPIFYEGSQPLTDLQQGILDKAVQNLDGKQVKNSTLQQQITDTVNRLKAAKDLDTAQRHLSDLKKEVRKRQSEQRIITEATEASQNFHGMDANQLAAELKTVAEQVEIPPELQAKLMGLFERLAQELPKGRLSDSLNQVQGEAVTPETLQDIIAALQEMEKSTDLTQLEAQLAASQKELALATIETESSGGGIANSEGTPGQDAGGTEVQGTREGTSNPDPQSELQANDTGEMENETDGGTSTLPLSGEKTPILQTDGEALTLTTGVSGNAEGFSEVFTGGVSDDAPAYLPFSEVVLNTSRAYAEAVENNRIPVRYRAQIKTYLEAISEENEK